MSTAELVLVIVVAVVIFYLAVATRYYLTRLTAMSKYAMTLLLDEFLYQKERKEFILLVESIKTENPNAIFDTAMLNLEDHAKQNAISKSIALRMWQLNSRAAKTGKSSLEANEEVLTDLRGQVRKTDDPFPNRDQNLKTGEMLAKARIAVARLRKRLRGY